MWLIKSAKTAASVFVGLLYNMSPIDLDRLQTFLDTPSDSIQRVGKVTAGVSIFSTVSAGALIRYNTNETTQVRLANISLRILGLGFMTCFGVVRVYISHEASNAQIVQK